MRIGLGFGLILGAGGASGSVSLTAPTLTWTSAETVDPPTFNIDLTDPQEGDIVRLYKDGVEAGSHTLTAGELSSLTFDLGLTAWGNGTYNATATHERGAVVSAASNTEVVTINVVAAGWTPADLGAKLVAWWKPADAATVTQSAGAVSQVNDKSGNAYHMAQATGSLQPAYSSGSLLIDADSMSASVPAGTFTDALTFAAVWQKTGSATTFNAPPLTRTSSGTAAPLDAWGGNRYVGDGTSFDVLSGSATDLAAATSKTVYVQELVISTSTYNEWWDGTLGSFMPFVSGVAPVDNATVITMGSRADGATTSVMTWFEGVAAKQLTTAERQQLEGYLAWTNGTEASLPAGHPYASAAP